LDLGNTSFSFSAVIGREDVQDGFFNADLFPTISVEVINDIGQHIHSDLSYPQVISSDHVWLNLNIVPHLNAVPQYSQVITNNLRVIFRIEDSLLLFFKSCGFHLKHRYERKR
jgi:hypothetical protein